MAEPFIPVQPPLRRARKGGILAVADVVEEPRLAIGGKLAYTDVAFGTSLGEAVLCYPEPAPAQTPKTYAGIDTFESIGYTAAAYAGVQCFIGGTDYEAEARKILELAFAHKVEESLDAYITASPTAPIGAATTLLEAVATLDNQGDTVAFPGGPVLLMNRGDAVRARAEKAIFGDKDGNLWTVNGTPVAASSEFTVGRVALTGSITIYKSPIESFGTIDHIHNREMAIAEQAFNIILDGGVAYATQVA